jgi:transposase
MRTKGSPVELERRRRLAVQRFLEGDPTEEIAHFLGVTPRSVRRWITAFLQHGDSGLGALPVSGRPAKLSSEQERIVLGWFNDLPTDHSFRNELWTAPRVAQRIHQEWGITFHPRSLNAWLRERNITPQKPRRVPRDRNQAVIDHWVATDWPRIKKKRADNRPSWFLWTKVAC